MEWLCKIFGHKMVIVNDYQVIEGKDGKNYVVPRPSTDTVCINCKYENPNNSYL